MDVFEILGNLLLSVEHCRSIAPQMMVQSVPSPLFHAWIPASFQSCNIAAGMDELHVVNVHGT